MCHDWLFHASWVTESTGFRVGERWKYELFIGSYSIVIFTWHTPVPLLTQSIIQLLSQWWPLPTQSSFSASKSGFHTASIKPSAITVLADRMLLFQYISNISQYDDLYSMLKVTNKKSLTGTSRVWTIWMPIQFVTSGLAWNTLFWLNAFFLKWNYHCISRGALGFNHRERRGHAKEFSAWLLSQVKKIPFSPHLRECDFFSIVIS